MPVSLRIEGLEEIQERMRAFPQKYKKALSTTLDASLLKIWELVPPYPSKPADAKHDRTGQLGQSLGSSESGGRAGNKPTIYRKKVQGLSKFDMAEFGTNKEYAPFVLGEDRAEHMDHWWKMSSLADKARKPVLGLFQKMAEVLARWLDGKGML